MIRNTTLLALMVVAVVLFVPFAVLMPRQDAFMVLNAICVAAATGAAMGWSKSTIDAVRLPARTMTAGHIVVVAVFLLCAAAVGVFLAQWLWRSTGRPDAILDSVITLFSRWVFAGGLVLAMTANWSTEGVVRPAAYTRTLLLVVVSVMVAALMIALGMG